MLGFDQSSLGTESKPLTLYSKSCTSACAQPLLLQGSAVQCKGTGTSASKQALHRVAPYAALCRVC